MILKGAQRGGTRQLAGLKTLLVMDRADARTIGFSVDGHAIDILDLDADESRMRGRLLNGYSLIGYAPDRD